MVDALASGASDLKVVEVRVFSWAPLFPLSYCNTSMISSYVLCKLDVNMRILVYGLVYGYPMHVPPHPLWVPYIGLTRDGGVIHVNLTSLAHWQGIRRVYGWGVLLVDRL